jgi:NAD-specific glutamate dehydrogenase
VGRLRPDEISAGGGIYPRHRQVHPLSPQVREALGIDIALPGLTPVSYARDP